MTADAPLQSPEGALARLGVDADSAVTVLRELGAWASHGPVAAGREIVEAAAATANPDLALRGLAAVARRHPRAWTHVVGEPSLLARVATVAGASEALGGLLSFGPAADAALAALLGALHPRGAEEVRAAALRGGDASAATLAIAQRAGLARIAARDLCGLAGTAQVTQELSDLAAGILAAGFELSSEGMPPGTRVAVIAMGKLGGRELNYVSDVDVLFVHEGDTGGATPAVERFLRLMAQVTPAGRAYEVDANLRPEGRDGPVVRSLASYERYWDRWARPWEFQALLKARPVAGDVELGRSFTEAAAARVWPDRLDPLFVAEVQRMKGVVEGSRPVRTEGRRQVKLAPGGLRDIEFAIQLLQLVHGRHDPSVREANTLAALAALADGAYVGRDDAAEFARAYAFLRIVEHRLQLARLRRTHTVPVDATERARLARAVGYRDDALERFDRRLVAVQALVRRLHEKLFYRPLLHRFAQVSAQETLRTTDGVLAAEPSRDRLVALGFSDADGSLRQLQALAGGTSRRARLLATLLPAILPTLAAGPDPAGGLAAFRSLADRLGTAPAFLRTLRDNPPVAELLAQVLSGSPLVGEWLEREPEAFRRLADLPDLERALRPVDYRALAEGLLRRGEEPERTADALRRLRRRESTRIAVRDLGGFAGVDAVGAELTGLAEACLHAGTALSVPSDVRMAVIGLGRLGGGELAYASDLDVLLVFEPADRRAQAEAAAELLLSLLSAITPEGQAFRVDLNLRPEGRNGPLVRSLDSYRAYYERWAQPWEMQALTQARPVAGDAAVAENFMRMITKLVYPLEPPAERLQAVRTMKARVERERAQGRQKSRVTRRSRPELGGGIDLKLGPGGLADVEWTIQLLALRHGGRQPALRRPGALAVIDACEDSGLLAGRDALWLREGWLLVSRVRNAAYLAGMRNVDRLPSRPLDQERIARGLGYPAPGRQAMLQDLARATRRVRRVHEARFSRD